MKDEVFESPRDQGPDGGLDHHFALIEGSGGRCMTVELLADMSDAGGTIAFHIPAGNSATTSSHECANCGNVGCSSAGSIHADNGQVPEPASLGLALTALAGVALAPRRRA